MSVLAALVALALVAGPAAAEEPSAVPAGVADAIRRLHPGARVVTADEVLGEPCGAAQRREQIFRADFATGSASARPSAST